MIMKKKQVQKTRKHIRLVNNSNKGVYAKYTVPKRVNISFFKKSFKIEVGAVGIFTSFTAHFLSTGVKKSVASIAPI